MEWKSGKLFGPTWLLLLLTRIKTLQKSLSRSAAAIKIYGYHNFPENDALEIGRKDETSPIFVDQISRDHVFFLNKTQLNIGRQL